MTERFEFGDLRVDKQYGGHSDRAESRISFREQLWFYRPSSLYNIFITMFKVMYFELNIILQFYWHGLGQNKNEKKYLYF